MTSATVTQKGRATAAKILTAAVAYVLVHGLQAIRMDTIAAMAGVNKRMLYQHFDDRSGLICAVLHSQALLIAEHDGISATTGAFIRQQFELPPQAQETLLDEGRSLTQGISKAANIILRELLRMFGQSTSVRAHEGWQQAASELLEIFIHSDKKESKHSLTMRKPVYRLTSESRRTTDSL
ncbi:MAG: TetR/AcrR family transcriptional regulator [Gammaproteobacteria bacterium]|nr:TetR/AcrR family transcriptional regulator [Gammaproteobacteria bacterium]